MMAKIHKAKLLDAYNQFPFHDHPLWRAVLRGELMREQIYLAETQHYVRTKAGQELRRKSLENARVTSSELFEALLDTYLEECTTDHSGPSHLELIERLVLSGGYNSDDLTRLIPNPANAAAIALYKDISDRGAAHHILGAGVVEHYYSQLSPKIYDAYTKIYGINHSDAETYYIHGSLDAVHAERAFSIMEKAIDLHGWDSIFQSVRDAFVATSLHYDAMLYAATNRPSYWNGVPS